MKDKDMEKQSRIAKYSKLIVLIILLGGIGGILMDRVILPYLASFHIFQNIALLNPQAPIVITRREEIRINEGINNTEVINKVRPALITVYVHEGNFGSPRFKLILQTSGVIVTSDGVVVIPSSELRPDLSITAVLPNQEIRKAEFLTSDPLMGLTFFKISATDLPVIRQGFSRELAVGEKLLAIRVSENPDEPVIIPVTLIKKSGAFGSLVGVYDFGRLNTFLETDFKPASFDLGSVVVNKDGAVEGDVSQLGKDPVVLRSEDLMLAVANFLDDKKVVWPSFKISYAIFDESQTKLFSIPKKYGILIKQAVATLREGDFVYSVNDKELTPQEGFQDILLTKKPGDGIKFKLFRNSKELELEITL